jgi:hypothetical protein
MNYNKVKQYLESKFALHAFISRGEKRIPGSSGFPSYPLDFLDRYWILWIVTVSRIQEYHGNRKDRTVILEIHKSAFSLE